ncbi:hypothetical protein OG982_27670 [Streptomyces sp. NBC_01551]|uniref:hypothetical protein n=1 Tax=Streptomyces sp. NBC_01551 TaxID=2975876 RepID=UPI00225AF5B6|nr:hypothetical protein [Streptomyces sp. NBC_01551]MCX4529431.1 hypothetical protein [Streptomyces sp. NBC_01551]
MERLLKADGASVDALVAVHAADLAPNGHTHLVIAKELEAVGRAGEALEWAERGLREAESDRGPDDELVTFVCERYTRGGRVADVVAIRRNLLSARPSSAAYRHLRTAARAADAWEGSERAGALEVLKAAALPDSRHRYCGSALVDALMDDADLDAAWQAAATDTQTGGSGWPRPTGSATGDRRADRLPALDRAPAQADR